MDLYRIISTLAILSSPCFVPVVIGEVSTLVMVELPDKQEANVPSCIFILHASSACLGDVAMVTDVWFSAHPWMGRRVQVECYVCLLKP